MDLSADTKMGYKSLIYWWARQDSNLQPDRYERSALTIELQAHASGDWLSHPRQCFD